MKFLSRRLLFLLSFLSYANGDEAQISEDGLLSNTAITAVLHNNYDFDVAVYFDTNGSPTYFVSWNNFPNYVLFRLFISLQLDIEASSSVSVNTYYGHLFHCTSLGSDPVDILSSVNILSFDLYSISYDFIHYIQQFM